jgi:hypothetical protein
MHRTTPSPLALTLLITAVTVLAALSLVSCGGGGGNSSAMPAAPLAAGGATAAGATSSGTLTAFGSVFVNGHEYATSGAHLIDDDTGASSTDLSPLEVGVVLDVKAAQGSTAAQPLAAELHWHPLARGFVDASDTAASTLTVMGQTVQLTAATVFSDHRACLGLATSPCNAISGQSGLAATSGSGSSAAAGNYVSVHGYLYAGGGAGSGSSIVATLVSVGDAPAAGAAGVGFKAEGVVTAVAAGSLTLGGLSVSLAGAACSPSPCAFSSGQVVSVFSAAAPALPATQFAASSALLRNRLPVSTAGSAVELEGMVSAVTLSPPGFALRGVNIDASALPAASLPAVGDVVRVAGTVAAGGTAVTASSVLLLHAARSASVGLQGDIGSIAAGTAAGTYVLTLLGQSITVDASARLADLSAQGGGRGDSSSHPFNITTFQSYLAASTSRHLLVRAQAGSTGQLSALSVTLVPASAVAGISGVVDAAPAPVNSSATGTPSVFSVHGLAVSADPAAVVDLHDRRNALTSAVAAGDFVIVRGSFGAGGLQVSAPATGRAPSPGNVVIDEGPGASDRDCF